MHSRDLERRHTSGIARVLGQRATLQVVVGALAIAAIVLAFAFRPGESSEGTKADAAAKPTTAPSAAVVVPTATAAPTPPKERTHVVASGDTLTGIAEKYYQDASQWSKIFEANRDVLPNSNSLQVGQKLRIPD